MNSMMTMDRTMSMGMGSMSMPMGAAMPMPAPMMGGMMIPRCMMKMEKCPGGMKMMCTCDDSTAAAMLQNLCMMAGNAMCGCSVMMNGMPVCNCNLTMGMCKMETMDMGVMMTCTSGDKNCEKMIQACCDCMTEMMLPGCTMCMNLNGMPVCCCIC